MRETRGSEIDAAWGPLAATKWASVKVETRTDQVLEIATPRVNWVNPDPQWAIPVGLDRLKIIAMVTGVPSVLPEVSRQSNAWISCRQKR